MPTLKQGDTAPGFSLLDQNGETVNLGDFGRRKVLVYFYPKANTPGCTKQSCAVRDAAPQLQNVAVAAVGISPDSPTRQKNFDTKYDLGFPLLADEDHAVADAWGVWGEKSRCGRTYMGIIRSAFLVDEHGKVLEAWYGVSPRDTVPQTLAAVGG